MNHPNQPLDSSFVFAPVLRRSGIALPIVLAMIVIVTIVAVAFVSMAGSGRSNGELNATIQQNQFLAQSALEAIVSDLRSEQIASADRVELLATAKQGNRPPIMSVYKGNAMMPSRVVKAGVTGPEFANLTKSSVNKMAFYPGISTGEAVAYTARPEYGVDVTGLKRAVAVSTADRSRDGHFVSPARWNDAHLVIGAGFTTAAQVPDWVLITRSGVAQTDDGAVATAKDSKPTNDKYVTGRCAYNIYDVGGLIDVNAAGSAAPAADVGRKGSILFADLSQIPGVNMTNVAAWRNTGNMNNLFTSRGLPQKGGLLEWSGKNGWILPYRNAAQEIDNLFLTRQDLLNWAAQNPGAIASTALPFLTTFSREVNAPSIQPEPLGQGTRKRIVDPQYANFPVIAGHEDDFNPDVPLLTNATGTPTFSRRFPLQRLTWLTATGPASGPNADPNATAPNIKKYFGLTYSGQKGTWDYEHGDNQRILYLSQVKAANRQPDFFEVLKAAINVGSLGKRAMNTNNSASTSSGPGAKSQEADCVPDYQILQIGAAIIDQADSDGFPTVLRIQDGGGQPTSFYGVENIPYLSRVRGVCASVNGNKQLGMFLQPEVWNPHNQSVPLPTDCPTQFRVVATGSITNAFITNNWLPSPTDDRVFGSVTLTDSPANNGITFSTVSQKFEQPVLLATPGVASSQATGVNALDQDSSVIGIHMTSVRLNPKTGTVEHYTHYAIQTTTDPYIWLKLQYADGANWITYNQMKGVNFSSAVIDKGPGGWPDLGNERWNTFAHVDPRSDRWGSFGGLPGKTAPPVAGTPMFSRITIRPTAAAGLGNEFVVGFGGAGYPGDASLNWSVGGIPIAQAPWALVSFLQDNNPVNNTIAGYYKDPDGIQRRAEGAYAQGAVGLPLAGTSSDSLAQTFQDSRPIILNRPFRSVGELGYCFRGMAWKNIDFMTTESGDAALLDAFCVNETDSDLTKAMQPIQLVAGKTNINTSHVEVLKAALKGGQKTPLPLSASGDPQGSGATLSASEANTIAQNIVDYTSGKNGGSPLINKSELVSKLADKLSTQPLQMQREAAIRALADAVQTRTWNFMIDLVVQTGRYPDNAKDLKDFLVSGESRYWIDLAIDRITGQVVDQQVTRYHE